MKKDSGLLTTYILSTLGDLSYAILLTGSMIYGIQLGGTRAQTGLIGGAYGITYLFMPAILGRIGDRLPRKVSLIVASIGAVGLGSYFLFLASSVLQLFIGQLLMGVVYGFYWQSIESYISENTHDTKEEHQRGMANFCIYWSIGYMTGPLIAGIFSDFDVKLMFLTVLVTYIVVFILVIFGLPSIRKKETSIYWEYQREKEETHNNSIETENSVGNKQNTRTLMKILFGMLIYAIVGKILLTYFTDYAVRKDTLNWTGTITGEVIFLFGVGRTIYFLFGRFHKGKIFRSSFSRINKSFLILGCLLIIIIFVKIPVLMGVLFLGIGFFAGLIYLSSLDLLIINERKSKGAKAGLFESMIGLGGMLSPIVAGAFGEINVILPFLVFAAFIFIFFILMNIKKNL